MEITFNGKTYIPVKYRQAQKGELFLNEYDLSVDKLQYDTMSSVLVVKEKEHPMRKITKMAVYAFENALPFNKGNTSVEVFPNVTILKLHGNAIAYKYNDPENTVSVTDATWQTNTTKERLNGILESLGAYIYQKAFKWFLVDSTGTREMQGGNVYDINK